MKDKEFDKMVEFIDDIDDNARIRGTRWDGYVALANSEKIVLELLKYYQIVDKDKVVLSREEYERLKDYTRIRIKPRNDVTSDYIRTLEMDNDGLLNKLKEVRKETAKKAYKDLKLLVPDNAVDIVTRYFKEIMDIEIK